MKLLLVLVVSAGSATAQSAAYFYDSLDRLIAATIGGSRIEYQYDTAGNLVRVVTPYTIELSTTGGSGFAIIDDLGKIQCGSDCSGVYDLNAIVTLTATTETGVTFDGWSGVCSGTDPCVVTVDGMKTLGASFSSSGADLSVSKDDGASVAIPGESLTYSIVVSNAGPGDVGDAEVADALPSAMSCEWTSAESGGASGSTGSGAGDLFETLSLPSGSSVTYTLACTIDPSAAGSLSNTASVTSSTSDPTPDDRTATDTNTLEPLADVWVIAELSPSSLAAGAPVTATLEVGNRGPSTATSVLVENTLPSGSTFQSATGSGWSCDENAGVVNCGRADLAPNESSFVSIEMLAPDTAGAGSNSVIVSSATPEDAAGDESDTDNLMVYGPPRILSVTSVASTETGSLTAGSRTGTSLSQIHLHVSHAMNDEPGDSGDHDVTNLGNYRLFRAAPDGSFSETSCTAATDLAFSDISYGDAGPDVIALYLGVPQTLEAGLYRLVVCGAGLTHLRDDFGSPLDGNGDGVGGDDFAIDFEVRFSNLLSNPNLDRDLAGWTTLSEVTGDVAHDAAVDAGGASTSGAARLANLLGANSSLALSQCVAVSEGDLFRVGGTVLTSGLGPDYPQVRAHVEMYPSADCSGDALSSESFPVAVGDSAGFWLEVARALKPPPSGTTSALVIYQISGNEAGAEAWLDDLEFLTGLVIFVDDFESGSESSWSSTSGVSGALIPIDE